jgi:repressor LexA
VYICDEELRKFLNNESKVAEPTVESAVEKIASPYSKEVTYVKVPLYDSIGCGELTYADSTSEEDIDVPSPLIKSGAKYFALRTKGDSMNELGIEDGDIILCQKNYQASSGSNAVVLVGDDATLKQIEFEKDGLVLIPKSTNPEHKIRKLTQDDEEFKVLGVFVCKL